MQMDMFSVATPTAVDLRSTPLPTPADVAARLGTALAWQALTLSQVLELWDSVYFEFVAALEGPIAHAKSFCKENGTNYGAGGPLARQFYQREYRRLTEGRHQLRAAADQVFCDNLTSAIEEGKAQLRAAGLQEEDVDASDEFFNQVVQRPNPTDLAKLLPVLIADLASEYQRLQE